MNDVDAVDRWKFISKLNLNYLSCLKCIHNCEPDTPSCVHGGSNEQDRRFHAYNLNKQFACSYFIELPKPTFLRKIFNKFFKQK